VSTTAKNYGENSRRKIHQRGKISEEPGAEVDPQGRKKKCPISPKNRPAKIRPYGQPPEREKAWRSVGHEFEKNRGKKNWTAHP